MGAHPLASLPVSSVGDAAPLLSHVGADGDPCPDAQALADRPALLRGVGHHGSVLGVLVGPLSFSLAFAIFHGSQSQRRWLWPLASRYRSGIGRPAHRAVLRRAVGRAHLPVGGARTGGDGHFPRIHAARRGGGRVPLPRDLPRLLLEDRRRRRAGVPNLRRRGTPQHDRPGAATGVSRGRHRTQRRRRRKPRRNSRRYGCSRRAAGAQRTGEGCRMAVSFPRRPCMRPFLRFRGDDLL